MCRHSVQGLTTLQRANTEGAGGALARKKMVAVTAWLRRFNTAAVSRNTWNVSRYPIHGSCSPPRAHSSGFGAGAEGLMFYSDVPDL